MRSDSLISKETQTKNDDALIRAVEYIRGARNMEDGDLDETARKILNDREFCNAVLEQTMGTHTWSGNIRGLYLFDRALRMESGSQANKK